MVRALLAALAAVVLVVVLTLLIVQSRTVSADYYAAHAERMRAIETSRNDLTAILQGMQSAFENGHQIPTSIELGLERLGENNALLQASGEEIRATAAVDTQLVAHDASLREFITDGQTFIERQNAFAEALRSLQDESPLVVKDLRRYNMDLEAQNTFSLAIDVIEYATSLGNDDGRLLAERIAALRDDSRVQARAPGTLDAFASAANQVIKQRAAAAIALQAVSRNRAAETLWSLSNAILDDNHRTVSRAERARLLLSVCTFLLLVGTGYAMFRLQASYRELNKSNRELESVNDSLEERVTERTQELSTAYEDLKESQVQLVQAEKMSSLGELVAGISHEINTPLWYLINNATVLQERMDACSDFCGIAEHMIDALQSRADVKETISRGVLDMRRMLKDGLRDDIDEARDLIQDSIEGLEELTELAQSLKDFSRLDRARQDDFNVNEGLDKTLLIMKNKLKSKVTVHKHYGEIPTVRCSPSQINQVFLNLLNNAADAIKEKGDIVIRTLADGNKIRISFADTGVGIPQNVMQKIRDPFFTTKDVGKGTGLGLSIVDQIVTSHGGELLIESEPGRGTTVTVVLPVIATAPITEADGAQAPDAAVGDAAANDPRIAKAEALADIADEQVNKGDIAEVASV